MVQLPPNNAMIQLPPINVWEALIMLNLLEREIKQCKRDQLEKVQKLESFRDVILSRTGVPPFRFEIRI